MAASQSDKVRKSYSFLQKTLNVGIDASVTTLTPNNVTSIPTDTAVSFVIDRVDSSGNKTPTLRELMTGVVSGANIINLLRGEQSTTAQPHLANAVIEFVNSGEMWNDLMDFLLQDHSNPNGNHKTLTDDNGNEWLERGSTASAVNQVKVTNAATATDPSVAGAGDDTNVGIIVKGKGTGPVRLGQATSTDVRLEADQPLGDSSGNEYMKFSKAASAVNEVTLNNAATNGVPGFTASGGDANAHIQIIGKGNGLTKVSVLRQNNTTNSYKHNSVMLTGWGVGVPGAATNLSETVSFGITFAAIPIVVLCFGGDNVSGSTTYGAGAVQRQAAGGWAHTISTVDFVARCQSFAGANWTAGDTVFYQWIAVGEL